MGSGLGDLRRGGSAAMVASRLRSKILRGVCRTRCEMSAGVSAGVSAGASAGASAGVSAGVSSGVSAGGSKGVSAVRDGAREVRRVGIDGVHERRPATAVLCVHLCAGAQQHLSHVRCACAGGECEYGTDLEERSVRRGAALQQRRHLNRPRVERGALAPRRQRTLGGRWAGALARWQPRARFARLRLWRLPVAAAV